MRKATGTLNSYTSGSRIEIGTFNSTGTIFVWMSKGNEKYHDEPGELIRYNDWTAGWTTGGSLYRVLMAVSNFTPRLLNSIPLWRPLCSRNQGYVVWYVDKIDSEKRSASIFRLWTYSCPPLWKEEAQAILWHVKYEYTEQLHTHWVFL